MDIGSEIGAYKKPWKNRVKIALVYPNKYSVGMSSLGFQTMYRLFNEKPFITCDRVFLPERAGERPRSVENSRSLQEFDFVFFSVSYSNDYLNVFEILKLSGIILSAEKRKSQRGPLIGAGGSAVYMNPEPLAPALDFFFLGEGEIFADFFSRLVDEHPGLIGDRENFLENIKDYGGIYIPEFLKIKYGNDGTVGSFNPKYPAIKIQRAYVEDLKSFRTYSTLFSEKSQFGGLFMEEISRGCARGCRFCAIGFIGRPYRTRPHANLEFIRRESPYKIGLLGAAISDHPEIKEIARLALERGRTISFSSFRADKIDDETARIIRDAGIETFTIAPESSERMRLIINKNLTDDELLEAVKKLSQAGVKNLKVYFMIGLPFEDGKDIGEIETLLKQIENSFGKRRITVSINPFVSKPFTPFQWFPLASKKYLKDTYARLKKNISSKKIQLLPLALESAVIDAVFSKGNRLLGEMVMEIFESGGNSYKELVRQTADEEFFIYKETPRAETLPWDFMDNHIDKAVLIEGFEKARELGSKERPFNISR